MKARLIHNFVYTTMSRLDENKELTRIIPAGSEVEIEDIDDVDICSFTYTQEVLNKDSNQNIQSRVWSRSESLVTDIDKITFDGVTSGDLSFWNLSQEGLLVWLDLIKSDFELLNISRLRKLITLGLNLEWHTLPTGLQALMLKYMEYKDAMSHMSNFLEEKE